jgi:hypothetical protein
MRKHEPSLDLIVVEPNISYEPNQGYCINLIKLND